ncbi:MAG TPA: type II secretion system protein [Candidatus Humimicrobiaceae bacterium]|nr:type II secretion system protein [Candidatus Humimicrobiaceae bacterium]
MKLNQPKTKKTGAGFTLIETLVYIGILAIIVTVIFSFLVWSVRSSTKAKVMRETSDNARRAMEIMTYEIREARTVYTPTTTSTQLSLETLYYLPTGEDITYIDFYICATGTQLCLKKEFQNPIALTSDNVEVSNLVFSRVVTGQIPSVQIELKIDYKNLSGRPEYQASVDLKSAVSLRNY